MQPSFLRRPSLSSCERDAQTCLCEARTESSSRYCQLGAMTGQRAQGKRSLWGSSSTSPISPPVNVSMFHHPYPAMDHARDLEYRCSAPIRPSKFLMSSFPSSMSSLPCGPSGRPHSGAEYTDGSWPLGDWVSWLAGTAFRSLKLGYVVKRLVDSMNYSSKNACPRIFAALLSAACDVVADRSHLCALSSSNIDIANTHQCAGWGQKKMKIEKREKIKKKSHLVGGIKGIPVLYGVNLRQCTQPGRNLAAVIPCVCILPEDQDSYMSRCKARYMHRRMF